LLFHQHYITFMNTILTKICKFLNYWYHNMAMFIVAHFIAVCFKEIMVSARWRCRDNSALTCGNYVKYCSINYRIVQLLVLHELFSYVRTHPIFSFCFHELCMDRSILQVLFPRIMNRIYILHPYTLMHLLVLLKIVYHRINAWNMEHVKLCTVWPVLQTFGSTNYVKDTVLFSNNAAMKYAKLHSLSNWWFD
jgi:hypothetical protein